MRISLRWLPLGLAILLPFLFAMNVLAHGDADWIRREELKNRMGELCCGPSDCSRLEDGDVKPVEGGFLIQSTQEFVPTHEALPVSPDGYWVCRWGGQRKCFVTPNMGM